MSIFYKFKIFNLALRLRCVAEELLEGKAKSFKWSAQNPCCPYMCPLALAAAHAEKVSISIFHLVGERHKNNLHNLSK